MKGIFPIAALLSLGGLLVLAALRDAAPDTIFYAQTASMLLGVVVAVITIAALMTSLSMAAFGVLAERYAGQRFSRLIGWKFLRSQRESEILRSRLRRSWHRFRAQSQGRKLLHLLLGLGLALSATLLTQPSAWNQLADTVSPAFASWLIRLLYFFATLLLLTHLIALLFPARRPASAPIYRQRNSVTLPTFISIVGVAIGLWALIVVLSVIHGLQDDLRDKILRTSAHALIENQSDDDLIPNATELSAQILENPIFTEAYPYAHGEVMMSSLNAIAINVAVKGMSPTTLASSEQLKGGLIRGSFHPLSSPESLISARSRLYPPSGADPDGIESTHTVLPAILLGIELADQLLVDIGDEVQLIAPDGDIGPTGLRPKLAPFRVAGIFKTGMYEYDQKLAYVASYAGQRLFDLGDSYNRIELRVTHPKFIDHIDQALQPFLQGEPDLRATSVRERNKNLFSALALERIVIFVILTFIVLVASLLIVSSLVMLVVEKVREISVLKALGAHDGAIIRSFVTIGGFIGLFGILTGVPLGVGTCLLIIKIGFPLPQEFYLDTLPVALDPLEITLFALAALGMCLLATIYPSRKAASLEPAEGLRHG